MKPNHASEVLMPEIHALAKRLLVAERSSHTLQPTALVNEAYLKLAERQDLSFSNRPHAIAVIVTEMRRVLIDHARGARRQKRGGGTAKRSILEDLDVKDPAVSREYDLDDIRDRYLALETLNSDDPHMALVIELRIMSPLTVAEIAELIGVSERTVYNDWEAGLLTLRRLLSPER